MSPIDAQLRNVLRAEAQEAAMDTDTPSQFETLTSRLDDVDRSRTRIRWIAGAAAALVVAAGAWVLTEGRLTPTTPPAGPVPSAAATASVDAAVYAAVRRHWTAEVTPASAAAALSGTPFEGQAQEILEGLIEWRGQAGAATGPWLLDLYMDGRSAQLYLRQPGSEPVKIDVFDFEIDAQGRLATSTTLGEGSVEYATYDVVASRDSLRLAWSSGRATGGAAADANEGPKRVLYASVGWSAA